ncbi:hypothetical protein DWQ67_04005 [Galactobacter caseinivorans]|uniref:SseB family protein n=1 Tax=Galactobacter caseinivorans TaxID=2676123 RepID=A0A496PKD4_9MICC|nr:hypothetical protein DWQ67_04005 [Galactobacter caseinivorans]
MALTGAMVDVRARAEREVLARHVMPAVQRWQRESATSATLRSAGVPVQGSPALFEAMLGSVVLVAQRALDGTVISEHGAVSVFTNEAKATAFLESFPEYAQLPTLESRAFADVVVAAHQQGNHLLKVDPPSVPDAVDVPGGPVFVLEDSAGGPVGQAREVDPLARLALLARDPERLAQLASAPGRLWWGLGDPGKVSALPLPLRDHASGASALPVFTSPAEVSAFDDLALPVLFDLDRLRSDWEPEMGLIVGLGSPEPPLELSWGRLRSLGFSAREGAQAYVAVPAPALLPSTPGSALPGSAPPDALLPDALLPDALLPGAAATGSSETSTSLPAPVGAVPASWKHLARPWPDGESVLGPDEERMARTLLAVPGRAVDSVHLVAHWEGASLRLALAVVADGVAHAASDAAGGHLGKAALAALRLDLTRLLAASTARMRAAAHSIPQLLWLHVNGTQSSGRVSYDAPSGAVSELLIEQLAEWGIPAHGCLPWGATLAPERSASSELAHAAASGQVDAAVDALVEGAPAWVATMQDGTPLVAQWPGEGVPALLLFSSTAAAARFRPELLLRRWSGELASHGLPDGVGLGLDPTATRLPLFVTGEQLRRLNVRERV